MLNDGIVAACARKNDAHFAAMRMQKGRTMMKNKYLTFSYDDGVTQDKRLVTVQPEVPHFILRNTGRTG